jgi:acyl-CoA reductase-like NAD-dependent aldehyde dehydrogenase
MSASMLSDNEGNIHPLGTDARRFLSAGPKKLLIDGRWVESLSGETFSFADPATEAVIGRAASAQAADVDAAVAAARAAFEHRSWGGISPHSRTKMMLNIARVFDAHVEELAELESLNNGTPLTVTLHAAGRLSQVFEYYSGWASKIYGHTNPSDNGVFNYTTRQPLGVCGQIVPWNGPLLMAAWKIAPALASGNTVVIKPAELTPLSTLRLGELLLEAGLPDGVVNIVTGFGHTAGAALATHPDVDKVSFTGSTAVGKQILAGSVSNMKRVTLELGGKSPNVIFDDADIDQAVAGAIRGFCSNSGQMCVAGSRVFVQRGVYEKVLENMVAAAGRHRVGNPFAADTTMGPLVSRAQFDRVNSYVELGHNEGASARLGGNRYSGKGYFVNPTLFADVDNNMRIAREEIFGPVAAVIPFENEDDAVLQGNRTEYGLAAGVWTRDLARAHRVAHRLNAGTVWVNSYMVFDPISPFGGFKQSGLGREHGQESMDAYTEVKSVFVNLNNG